MLSEHVLFIKDKNRQIICFKMSHQEKHNDILFKKEKLKKKKNSEDH